VWKTGGAAVHQAAPQELGGQHAGKDMRRRPGHPDPVVAPVDERSRRRRASIVTLRPVSPRRAAATATAQDDDPEASVIPVPRSQTRMRRRSGPRRLANCTLVRSGNSGWCSMLGPTRGEVHRLGVVHEEGAMGVAHAGRDRIAVDGQVQRVHRLDSGISASR
jgi:hypothetical protein